MKQKENNFAYIDGANLHNGIKSLGWILDYKKFRIWLREKYNIQVAYLFIGLIPKNKDLYTCLQEYGFTLVFKEVIYDGSGKPKGNCDSDLVLQATCDMFRNNFHQALIVSSDGDYTNLVKFLKINQKLIAVLSPSHEKKCSILLKRTGVKISYINDQCSNLKFIKKEKIPDGDKTP